VTLAAYGKLYCLREWLILMVGYRAQAAMTQAQQHGKQDGLLYKHLSKRKELWLDFMADTGDGGNSTYSIARLLAQPFLCVTDEKCCQYHHLPRSNLLLVGGDLAYSILPFHFVGFSKGSWHAVKRI
jgi:hypothetical protein